VFVERKFDLIKVSSAEDSIATSHPFLDLQDDSAPDQLTEEII
jgi:hypothetical protein